MRTIILTLLLLLCLTMPSFAQYAFQITTERDVAGKCINWQGITGDVSYVLNQDTTKQVFTDTPDETTLDNDDLQEWYVDADSVPGFYLVSFSFSAVGLTISGGSKYTQYWFRYSKDGVLYSESNAVVVMKPRKPIKG